MSPKHGPWRADADFIAAAREQIKRLDTQETIAVDRAVVAIQTDPRIGDLAPGGSREYRDPGTSVRIVYYVIEGGGKILIVYIEV